MLQVECFSISYLVNRFRINHLSGRKWWLLQNGNHVVAYSCFTIVWIQGCVKSYDVFEKLDYYKIWGSWESWTMDEFEKVGQWINSDLSNLRKLENGWRLRSWERLVPWRSSTIGKPTKVEKDGDLESVNLRKLNGLGLKTVGKDECKEIPNFSSFINCPIFLDLMFRFHSFLHQYMDNSEISQVSSLYFIWFHQMFPYVIKIKVWHCSPIMMSALS